MNQPNPAKQASDDPESHDCEHACAARMCGCGFCISLNLPARELTAAQGDGIDPEIEAAAVHLPKSLGDRVDVLRSKAATLSQPIEPQGAVVDGIAQRLYNVLKAIDERGLSQATWANAERTLADYEAALPVAVGAGEAVVWVDPYELMMVREHGGVIVATHEAEPESKRTQPLYMTPTPPAGKAGESDVTKEG